MKRIKSGDEVIVTTGKSKGHIGKVLSVGKNTVVVEGGNLVKKHIKGNPQQPDKPAGIVSREAAINISNVAHYNPVTKKADKVGFKYLENNGTTTKVRFYKSNDEIIDRA